MYVLFVHHVVNVWAVPRLRVVNVLNVHRRCGVQSPTGAAPAVSEGSPSRQPPQPWLPPVFLVTVILMGVKWNLSVV